MVTSEFNQSNPTTNHQCDFGQPIVNTNTAQIENVSKLLKVAQKTNKSYHESISTQTNLFLQRLMRKLPSSKQWTLKSDQDGTLTASAVCLTNNFIIAIIVCN